MVAVLHAAPRVAAPAAVAAWLESLAPTYQARVRETFRSAFELARDRCNDERLADGEAVLDRAVGAATIVASLHLDPDSIVAALLCGLPAVNAFDTDEIQTRFGIDVATLIAGVARMDSIRAHADTGRGHDAALQAENLRKMLLAMVDDIRIVLIKLAERTQALRYLTNAGDEARQQAAKDVLDIFAPLANRLGVWQLKWELEDLSLRALEPAEYQKIARHLDERRLDRQRFIDNVIATLRKDLADTGVKAEVTGRPKHIYSIWNKMRRKPGGIEAIYDIRAVRILVDSIKDCYTALGIVHQLWTPVTNEFDDYIAKPKANNYRSLHTAVIGPGGKPLEVQIRTWEMHRHSEYGVASHWQYKEAGKIVRPDAGFNEKIGWLRQILEWKDAVADSSEWLTAFKSSLFVDSIYVLTPQGKVIDLPRGSTPVDFAYAVHTGLGHRCRGARVDGQMVPLNYVLKNGQQVEIVAAKQGGPSVGPSRDWLNPDLGYVHSHRARTKARQWFKAQQLGETIAQGRALVERELARQGRSALKLDAVAAKAGFAKLDDFFAAYARDDISSKQVQAAIQGVAHVEPEPVAEPEVVTKKSRARGSGSGILVVGVDRLMTGLARCCKPAPPDAIVGFITRGKGVTIHRANCANVARMRAREPERLIDANWGAAREEVFPVDIIVEAMDRQGLLRDISEIFSRDKINVTAVNTLTRSMQARMSFTIEVESIPQLKRALALVKDVRGVMSATRR
ncbi:MAG TPA: bifunctional (p)ppGpp synthetase/guanosine-3',5'-bis(diphosphate) 3'-pyrophosphohydrolase [Casimicrobiaceae bacterium]